MSPDTAAATIAARITDLLPGTVFDAHGHGAFQRAHYAVTFAIDADGPGVDVHLNHADGFAALQRVASRTGWHVIDADRNSEIDLDGSKTMGAVVLSITHPDSPSQPIPGDPPAWRRWMWHAAAMLILVLVWVGLQRTRPVPRNVTSPDGLAPAAADVPAGAPSAPANASPDDKAAARRNAQRYLSQLAERMRARMEQVKLVAPEFRGDPIVQQLLDYDSALSMFYTSAGERRVLSAERLADPSLLPLFWPDGLLPSLFATPVRNAYRFESVGVDCGHRGESLRQLDDFCEAIVYVARPVVSSAGLRTYAFYTTDRRIHYRQDGQTPTRADPTVDNTTPSAASDIPGAVPELTKGASAATTKEEAGLLARFHRVLQRVIEAAGFGSLQQASVAYREADVIRDFRIFFAAESQFTQMDAGHYAAPEKLADAANYQAVQWQPLLPGYFVQPVRQGYQFEFIGDGATTPRLQTSMMFGQVYSSFVYAALPVDPGPAGRRSLAIYPDGVVFASSARRVPTRDDVPLGDR
jgi:hypothetical protein